MKLYNFQLAENGDILGHSIPGYPNLNREKAIECVPDQAYREDDWNWTIKITREMPKMVHRATGLTPAEESQDAISQLVASNVMETMTETAMQKVLTQTIGSIAQSQTAITQLAAATAVPKKEDY